MTGALPVLSRGARYLEAVARTRAGLPCRPRLLTWIVTFACNARCVMCDSWKKPRGRELDAAAAQRALAGVGRVDAVRITGGEPFVRRDLDELLAVVGDRLDPLVIHVTTNGLLTDRIVEVLERRDRRRRLELMVSLDGVGAAHDRIRGRQGAYDRTLETLGALAPRARELNLRLSINQCLFDDDAPSTYRALRRALEGLPGVRHHAVFGYDDSATYGSSRAMELPERYPLLDTGALCDPRDALAFLRTLESDAQIGRAHV